jgi:hypothetical protein
LRWLPPLFLTGAAAAIVLVESGRAAVAAHALSSAPDGDFQLSLNHGVEVQVIGLAATAGLAICALASLYFWSRPVPTHLFAR